MFAIFTNWMNSCFWIEPEVIWHKTFSIYTKWLFFSIIRCTDCLQISKWTLSVTSACRLEIVVFLDFQWFFNAATMTSLPLVWLLMEDLWGKCSHQSMLNFILCDSVIYTSSRNDDLLKGTALKASLLLCLLRGYQMCSSLCTNHDVTVIFRR